MLSPIAVHGYQPRASLLAGERLQGPHSAPGRLSLLRRERRLFLTSPHHSNVMMPLPTPRRLLDALASQRRPVDHGIDRSIEPVLQLDSLPPLAPDAAPPLPRRAIELELEEGSRRLYVPMAEAEVVERPRGK